MKKKFPLFKQLDQMDCAPSCLYMISKYYGKTPSIQHLRKICDTGKDGTTLLSISEAAESLGFRTLSARVNFDTLIEELPLPVIVYWQQRHFIIVYKADKKYIHVADPAFGLIKLTHQEFIKGWSVENLTKDEVSGLLLVIEPSKSFYETSSESEDKKSGLRSFFGYVKPYKKFIYQIMIGLLVNTLLSFIFPFLTQSIVDVGINNRNISFINVILIAQLTLFFSQSLIGGIRSWIFLHMGSRISITILSDFIIKMMRLPMLFFDNKRIGDILQRIKDNGRIQSFLTSSLINTVFGALNFFVFSIVLFFYNRTVLLIFLIGSIFYFGWILLFQKKRKELDYKSFDQMSANQSNLIELLKGAQEIKQQNCETQKRWQWERIQAKQFRLGMTILKINQTQQIGSFVIDQVKNIMITYFTAKAVINGEMTLGMMMSVQYILGQLNGPLSQAISFVHDYQDAKISLERLQDIHNNVDEEAIDSSGIKPSVNNRDIVLNNISFYYGAKNAGPKAVSNVSCVIPFGKTTAIVGMSGSGKTTILKLLLKFYIPTSGEIKVGEHNLANINPKFWRKKCGAVLQDGFIFSDTIAQNIAISDEDYDGDKLSEAIKLSNLDDYINGLPLGYNTKIGENGQGLSQGQKQRLLLARAFYNNPDFLFFDEATNSLDSKNEAQIMSNIYSSFTGKTLVIVAHRLSTVKNADNIIVMDKGEILESGTHEQLVANKNLYYALVKDQLALG